MALPYGYLIQQGFALGLSSLVAIAGLLFLRQGQLLVERPCRRVVTELLLIGGLQALLGISSDILLWGRYLPGEAVPADLALGLTFYWLVLIWPLRVFLQREELSETGFGGIPTTIAIILCLSGIYSGLLEPSWLQVHKREIALPSLTSEVRIAYASELHLASLGLREEQALATMREFDPDLVILTGPLVGAELSIDSAVESGREFVTQAEARTGTFVALSADEATRAVSELLSGTGVQRLSKASIRVPVGAKELSLQMRGRQIELRTGSSSSNPVLLLGGSSKTAIQPESFGTPAGYAPPMRLGRRPELWLLRLTSIK